MEPVTQSMPRWKVRWLDRVHAQTTGNRRRAAPGEEDNMITYQTLSTTSVIWRDVVLVNATHLLTKKGDLYIIRRDSALEITSLIESLVQHEKTAEKNYDRNESWTWNTDLISSVCRATTIGRGMVSLNPICSFFCG